jgi:WD40 repeat protein
MDLPVIVLAFANNPTDPDQFLAQLRAEREGILQYLDDISGKLCETVIVENADIDSLLTTLQTYGKRMVVFHYAGHAGSFHLLLESSDRHVELAHAGGLAQMLGLQNHLKLVFLNGCSTQKQADQLMEAGVPAIIATSQAINDGVARDLSLNFYHSLSTGDDIFTAFREAVASVQLRHGGNTRSFVKLEAEIARETERFPWDFYVRPGAETIREWNLPEEAHDPLFGLPELPLTFPESPYRFLEWFREEDARIFFGRSYQIRSLYEKIKVKSQQHQLHQKALSEDWDTTLRPADPPVIHLYGRSGVGKSSLLAAGLSPRLQEGHAVRYLRRRQELGLTQTLRQGLEVSENEPISTVWHRIEQQSDKPLIVFLDQGEEVFTRPLADQLPKAEWAAFLTVVRDLFFSDGPMPKGKLVLSYRKEYLAEIEHAFRQAELPWQKVFLQRLQRADIIDAVTGVSRESESQAFYGLQIAPPPPDRKNLAELVADHLLEDQESPVAPVLQILLSNMWREAHKLNSQQPVFTHDLFDKFSTQGLAMGDFLHQQLKSLETWRAETVESGWVLDLLAFHTTEMGTATARTEAELREQYLHREGDLTDLLRELKDRYLLIDPKKSQKTRLAHDTLAPLVRKRYDESNTPGQQSRRVFRNRLVLNQDVIHPRPLDLEDLEIIEKGDQGRRKLDKQEAHLLACSLALNQTEPTPRLNLNHALKAWELSADALSRQAIYQSFYSGPLYHEPLGEAGDISLAEYAPDGRQILIVMRREQALLLDEYWSSPVLLERSRGGIEARWSADGQRILILNQEGELMAWNRQGKQVSQIQIQPPLEPGGKGRYRKRSQKGSKLVSDRPLEDFAFHPNGQALWLLHPERGLQSYRLSDGKLETEDLSKIAETNLQSFLLPQREALFSVLQRGSLMLKPLGEGQERFLGKIEEEIEEVLVSQDEQTAILRAGTQVYQLDLDQEDSLRSWLKTDEAPEQKMACDQAGGLLAMLRASGTVDCYRTSGRRKFTLLLPEKRLPDSLSFHPDADRILSLMSGQVLEWHPALNGFHQHQSFPENVRQLQWSGDTLLVCGTQQFHIYNELGGGAPLAIQTEMPIQAAALSPLGTHVAVGGLNGRILLYDLEKPASPLKIDGFSLEQIMDTLNQMEYEAGNAQQVQMQQMQINRPFASSTMDGEELPFDLEQMEKGAQVFDFLRERVKGHWGAINSLAFSPDGQRLLSGGEDWAVKLWDLQGNLLLNTGGVALFPRLHDFRQINPQKILAEIRMLSDPFAQPGKELAHISPAFAENHSHTGPINWVAFSRDGSRFLSVSRDQTVRIWQIAADISAQSLLALNTSRALFTTGDEGLLCMDRRKGLQRYSLQSPEPHLSWEAELELGQINDVALSPDGEKIALAGSNGNIGVFSVDGEWLGNLAGTRGAVNALSWYEKEEIDLISGGAEKKVRVWQLNAESLKQEFEQIEGRKFRISTL